MLVKWRLGIQGELKAEFEQNKADALTCAKMIRLMMMDAIEEDTDEVCCNGS